MYLDRIINEPGEGNGNPLQHSCQDNSMDRGAWQATAHGVAKSWTRLKQLNTHTKFNENLVIRAKLKYLRYTFKKHIFVFVVQSLSHV